MKVVVGLGNPGKSYANTRHNVGFWVIDQLGIDFGIEIIKAKHKALIGDKFINGEKVMLVKPMTFMNLSGESVSEIVNFYKVAIEDIIVVFDDASIPLGNIRVRETGASGGHNGMKSLISHLGRQDFNRIRIGIGEASKGFDLADYVLSQLAEEEKSCMKVSVNKAVDCVKLILNGDIKDAMNKYNKRNKALDVRERQENGNERVD